MLNHAAKLIYLLLAVGLSLIYALKPNWAAALTIFPAWTWLPFLLWPLLAWKQFSKHWLIAVAGMAVIYVFAFSEEWRSLVRTSDFTQKPPGTIRIASLNCAGGIVEAAREVKQFSPDIVLFQESPGRPELEALAKELWPGGVALPGPDGSILTRGTIHKYELPRGTSDFVAARVSIDGMDLNVVSLRLMPPSFHVDLYNPQAWADVAQNQRLRSEELRDIMVYFDKLPKLPSVIGGDFNAQPGDRSLGVMPERFRDAFYEAGTGWAHTAVNDYPLARIDQIWISDDLKATQLKAQKTVHSDHRMVVCDVKLH